MIEQFLPQFQDGLLRCNTEQYCHYSIRAAKKTIRKKAKLDMRDVFYWLLIS
jgi:hypothetical protein